MLGAVLGTKGPGGLRDVRVMCVRVTGWGPGHTHLPPVSVLCSGLYWTFVQDMGKPLGKIFP